MNPRALFVIGVALGGCAASAGEPELPVDHLPDVADSHAPVEARNLVHPCEVTQAILFGGVPDRRTLTTYAYDDLGRAIQDVITDTTQSTEQINYKWDGDGHLISEEDNRLAGAVGIPQGVVQAPLDTLETLTYDTPGRLVADTIVDELAVALGEPVAGKAYTFSEFDDLGHPAHADEIESVVVTNDIAIPPAHVHSAHSYTYDELGRRSSLQIADDTGETVYSWTTIYDEAARTETTTAVTPGVRTITTHEEFDAAYHLIGWTTTTLGADGAADPLVPPAGGVAEFAGDRRIGETESAAANEVVIDTVDYGCKVDQDAQENHLATFSAARSQPVPLDAPFPEQ